MGTGILNREQILGATDRRFEEVEVPEWGGKVRVGEMTGSQRDAYEMDAIKARESGATFNVRAALVARCVVDESGKQLFEVDDVVQLGSKSAGALNRVFIVAARLNALTREDGESAKKS